MARPGFSICVCPDNYLVRARIEKELSAFPPEGGGLSGGSSMAGMMGLTDRAAPAIPALWERHAYWGDEPLPASFWEHLTLQGLFSTPKALVIHNAQNIPADSWRRVSSALGTPNSETWPFFCLTVAFERGKPKIPAHIAKLACFSFAEKKGWLWTDPGLDERSKTAFVRAEAGKRGLTFAPGALEAVASRLPADASAIGAELDKLALAAPESGVVDAGFADIFDRDIEPDIFSIIRTLQSGGNALAVWEQALASGKGGESLAFPFLAMLAREARQLWQISLGEPVRLPPQVATAKTALARSLGLAGIARLWHLALEADKGVKTGERSPEQALEILLASLARLFRPART